ncbi:hypothetical protein PHLCEN_2v845 [Hermanssonia centrifuga]|uniref:Uncharacterized protein n=1 Tax=Hermanssonia centrifuga TaxID=98765 RepID=A0A2R6S513_9APHY|nr:hypothetical protein PHLCEN_2v845 [Hermanssonia centrifuga]
MSADAALPTPPHSPHTYSPAKGAVNLLDSLTSFYQQEQYWIHHTRAALELTVTKGIDAPALDLASSEASSPPCDAASPASSCTSSSTPPPTSLSVSIKPDPDAENVGTFNVHLTMDADAVARNSRWIRRKNQMRLKLDGIAPHHRRRRPARAPPSEPGARLLEMFAELVDARMESCQRISRLTFRSVFPPPGYNSSLYMAK